MGAHWNLLINIACLSSTFIAAYTYEGWLFVIFAIILYVGNLVEAYVGKANKYFGNIVGSEKLD